MKYFIFAALMLVITQGKPVFAQHEGHQMPQPKPAVSPAPEPKPTAAPGSQAPAEQPEMDMSGHMDHGVYVMHDDQMFIRLGQSESNLVPMGRMGSGTSWQPDSSPMPMMHKQSGEWLLMFHYNFTLGVNRQGGPRGVTKFESANCSCHLPYGASVREHSSCAACSALSRSRFHPAGRHSSSKLEKLTKASH